MAHAAVSAGCATPATADISRFYVVHIPELECYTTPGQLVNI